METVILRDYDKILKLLLEMKKYLFDQSITEETIQILSKKYAERAEFIVVKKQEENIGFISFYCNDAVGKNGYISMIVVKSEYQQNGVGTQLLREAEHISIEHGMKQMQLVVDKENMGAIEFYHHHSFRQKKAYENQILLEKNTRTFNKEK